MKRYDIHKITDLINDRKLMCQVHPTLPLKIYKYTVDTQFSKEWNEITLAARGLVLDADGNAYTNPFPKFFNLEELTESQLPIDIPYQVFDKVDGSCIEIFRYKGQVIVNTLGSFESDQAKIAEQLLYSQYANSVEKIQDGFTYIFELVVPENRIVLNYGEEKKLVLLAVRNNDTDEETLPVELGFPVVDEVKMSIQELITEKQRPDFTNKEGFVIRFANGFRVKIKYEEYFRLHKIMTGVNERFVWEFMKENKPLPLDNVPDEFFQYVTSVQSMLRYQFAEVEEQAKFRFKLISKEGQSRKEFALEALKYDNRSILFKLLEGKEYSNLIWMMIRPEAKPTQFSSLKRMDADA